jgi:protein SCO1/2
MMTMTHPLRRLLVLLAVLSVLPGFLSACSKKPPPFRGTALENVVWGGDFVLMAHTGERYDTQALRGKVQVVFFGYTHCPDICAPTLAKLAQARRQFGDQAGQVQVLFITVDPEYDTPARLGKFLAGFDSTFIGLTGAQEEVRKAASQHMSYYQRDGQNSSQVTHTGTLYLKDRNGRMRVLVKESVPVEDLVHDLRLLLEA